MDQREFFIQEARNNKIFIYPTDTIYGIWAIANEENKRKINRIKGRPENQLVSIIAPDEERIREHYSFPASEELLTHEKLQSYLDRYHGVTFILSPEKSGVRLIKHPIQDFVQGIGDAFISTSVNKTGEINCHSVKDISPEILPYVDYIIDYGPLDGAASVLINMRSGEIITR